MILHATRENYPGYEQVVSFSDDDFRCFIAIHNTNRGPALGGCRLKPYLSSADALLDSLRLAKSMTYKSSLAGLNLGGGKCIVMADRATPDIMHKVGEAVNYFGGDYIIAEDIGTTLSDIEVAGEVTDHIVHVDGSQMTARGVLVSIIAAALYCGEWGHSLDGVPIWVQGLGKVGMPLAHSLAKLDHANVYVSDLRDDLVAQACAVGAHPVSEIDKKFMSIYVPCATGQVITPSNVHTTHYTIICGAANNQLADDCYAKVLHDNHVIFCPDWVVNAGGIITAAHELGSSYDEMACMADVDNIGVRLLELLDFSERERITPLDAAKKLAESGFKYRN
jgi:leucine dehydrogenase